MVIQRGSWEFHVPPYTATKEVDECSDFLPDHCKTNRTRIVVGTFTFSPPPAYIFQARATVGCSNQASGRLGKLVESV